MCEGAYVQLGISGKGRRAKPRGLLHARSIAAALWRVDREKDGHASPDTPFDFFDGERLPYAQLDFQIHEAEPKTREFVGSPGCVGNIQGSPFGGMGD